MKHIRIFLLFGALISAVSCLIDRGGSWLYPAWLLRSATRERNPADYRDRIMGFRVAKTISPDPQTSHQDPSPRVTENPSAEADRIGIERLHRQDIEATLSDKADELAKLWDNEAVRIQPGTPAEVGKATIFANDRRWEAKSDRPRTLCYKPEIQDVQVAGDWAFEWGYMSYKDSSTPRAMRGKVMRVMKRQSDGSWKFARVIVFDEKNESAAPMSDPCK
jgi:ketosteroid isomerase-like protein